MVELISVAFISFVSLISAAFTKIMIMFLTVLMVFFFVPQSRMAAMLAVSVVSSILGGTIIHLLSAAGSWSLILHTSICLGAGLGIFPFLMMFSQFYKLLSEDRELHTVVYKSIKSTIMSRFSKYVTVQEAKDVIDIAKKL